MASFPCSRLKVEPYRPTTSSLGLNQLEILQCFKGITDKTLFARVDRIQSYFYFARG